MYCSSCGVNVNFKTLSVLIKSALVGVCTLSQDVFTVEWFSLRRITQNEPRH